MPRASRLPSLHSAALATGLVGMAVCAICAQTVGLVVPGTAHHFLQGLLGL